MSAHTPPPWEVLMLPDGRISIATMADERRASIVCRIANSVSRRPLDGEDEANAHLIAAAPDLLAALNMLAVTATSGDAGFKAAYRAALAAIAKAEGKS